MKRALPALAALAAVGLSTTSAQAETIHTPPPSGAVFHEGDTVPFDWKWDRDQYATTAIYFTTSADPNDPVWYGPDKPGRIRVTDNYGTGFDGSNAYVDLAKWKITPGQWYWRLCSKSIDGEDDKCQLRDRPHALLVLPRPVLTPAPEPVFPDPVTPDPPAPPARDTLTRTEAAVATRRAIRSRFDYGTMPSPFTMVCNPISSTAQSCRVTWRTKKHRFKGRVRVALPARTTFDVLRTDRKTGQRRRFR
jgi:hypothetical protein